MAGKIKPIVIRDSEENEEYTLEFNREAVKFAESRGFKLDDLDSYPMSKVPEFFWYAFRMHHKRVSLVDAENILRKIGGMNEAVAKRLIELWVETYNALGTEDEKNPNVTVEL